MGNHTLRVAVIGAGQIAQRGHLPGFSRAGAELVALCDNAQPELESIAAAYGIRRTYPDWKGMLAEGGFDVVSICTPPYLHFEMAVECLQRGMHVLVEKPMAVNLGEAQGMVETARKTGGLLMVAHNQRFSVQHQLVKEILDSGELGRIYMVNAVLGHSGPEVWSPTQRWYFRPEQAGRGVMADLGYHKLDLIRWLTGQDYVHMAAFSTTFEKNTTLEDSVVINFQLSSGTLGTIQVSWVFRPDWENSLVIRGERGVIRVPTEVSDPVKVLLLNRAGNIVETEHRCSSTDPSGWFGAVQAFVDAIQNQAPSPVSGEEGYLAMKAVLAASESVEQNKIVSLIRGR